MFGILTTAVVVKAVTKWLFLKGKSQRSKVSLMI